MKKSFCVFIALFMGLFGLLLHHELQSLSTLAKNDPYPLFVTDYPYNQLLQATKNYLTGRVCEYLPDHFSIAMTGFYQKANWGRDYDRQKAFLGDLTGKWNVLGMLYGPVPTANVMPTTLVGTRLGEAKLRLFGDPAALNCYDSMCLVNNPLSEDSLVTDTCILIDCTKRVGFVSAPVKYRKHGIRFEMAFQPIEDIGVFVQGGYADIKQTLTGFIDCASDITSIENTPFTTEVTQCIKDLLTSCSSINRILREQKIDKCSDTQNVCDFREGSFEDLRFSVWLRHIFPVNQGVYCEWPEFLFIPFFNLEGSVYLGKKMDRMKFLAVPFGNNGHSSIGFTGGFHIDFNETVEIGFHGGITHFSSKHVSNYRLPNHPTQSSVFPFSTDIDLQPGNNHHFSVSLHAYRFVDKLSAHVEFVFVNHDEDHIELCDPALADVFRVCQQECMTKFTSQFLTTAANYEISPNLTLGFAVQWPLQQRNAYRSTTVLGTLKATF